MNLTRKIIVLLLIIFYNYGQGILNISPSDTVMVCKGDTAYFEISHNVDSIVWVPQNGTPSFQLDTGKVFTSESVLFILQAWLGGSIVDSDSVFIGVVEGGISAPNYTCVGTPTIISFSGVGVFTSIYWNFNYGNPPGATTVGPHSVMWGSTGPKSIMQVVIGYGCIDTVYDTVQVLPSPAISAGSDKVYCKPDTGVMLDAQLFNPPPGCSVSWSPADGLSSTVVLNPLASPDTTTTYVLTLTCNICGVVKDSVTVYVSEKPTVNIVNNPVLVCEGEVGDTIFTEVLGGIPPYTYEWQPNPPGLSSLSSPNPVVNPYDTLTIYSLVVQDSLGCESDTTKAYVVKRPRPRVEVGPDITICENGPGDTLHAQILNYSPAQVIFYWTPGTGLNDSTILEPYARPTQTTMYNLVVIEPSANCVSITDSSSTVVVNVVSLPKAQAGYEDSLQICEGDSVHIGAIGQNGDTLGYTYVWTPAIGLSDTSIADPWASPPYTTTYYLQIVSKGCTSEADSITIEVIQHPIVSIPPVPGICPGDSIAITPVVASNFPLNELSFLWTPSSSLNNDTILNPIASPDITTTYFLTTTYKSLCSSLDSITVYVVGSPLLGINKDTTICQGDTVQPVINIPDTLNYVGYWSPNYNISNIYVKNPLLFPDTTTAYIYTVNYNSPYSSCTARDTMFINVQHTPDVLFEIDTSYICANDPVKIIGKGHLGAADFYWSVNDSFVVSGYNLDSLIIAPDDTVKITLTIKEGICSATDSTIIPVFPRPKAYFVFDSTKKCFGEPVYFFNLSEGASFYIWDLGDGYISNDFQPVHIYDSSGYYSVKLTAVNKYGCVDSFKANDFVVINPELIAGFYKEPLRDTLIMPESNILLRDTSYGIVAKRLWLLGDGTSYSSQEVKHYYDSPGTYEIVLIVSDDNNCTDSTSKTIYVFKPMLEIPNVFTPNNDGFNDYFQVKYDGVQTYNLEIYDRYGKIVFSTNSPTKYWDGTYNGKPVPEGTYFYIVKIGEDGFYKGSVSVVR